MNTTLPTDSEQRKQIPIVSGCLDYFPAALAGVARISHAGNQKHNPGEPLHHARGKSTDHADCIARHLMDLQGILASYLRVDEQDQDGDGEDALAEASALAWRALALSQELHERFGAPLAPGARLPVAEPVPSGALKSAFARHAELVGGPLTTESVKPAPFRIEAGKRYVRRDGSISGPIRHVGKWLRCEKNLTYETDGRWLHGTKPDDDDLIRVYVEQR